MMRARTSLPAIAPIITACGGDSTSPRQPSSSQPATPSTTEWTATQRFVSVTGPDNCWIQYQRGWLTGAVFPNLPMSVTRSGTSIALTSPFFQVNYAGTMSGREFSAACNAPLEGGGRTCDDGSSFLQMPGTSALSGRIADDEQTLTATEVNSYVLNSGEPVTYRWDWQAQRK